MSTRPSAEIDIRQASESATVPDAQKVSQRAVSADEKLARVMVRVGDEIFGLRLVLENLVQELRRQNDKARRRPRNRESQTGE